MIEGWYSYKFVGYTIGNNGASHQLVGVGTLRIAGGEVTSGIQQSSILRLSGAGSTLETDTYEVFGTYTPPAGPSGKPSDIGSAELIFTSPAQQTRDIFSLVANGGAGFWFISTKPEIWSKETKDWVPAQDIVNGEAIRITALDTNEDPVDREAAAARLARGKRQ